MHCIEGLMYSIADSNGYSYSRNEYTYLCLSFTATEPNPPRSHTASNVPILLLEYNGESSV